MNLILVIYNILQLLLAPFILPLVLVYILSKSKYRKHLAKRIFVHNFSVNINHNFKTVWIHTLSFGEVNAAVPFIKAVCERWPEFNIVCSAGTSTGYEYLKKKVGSIVSNVTFLPYDIFFLCNHVQTKVNPDCFVLIETDVWPNWLWSLKFRGCRIIFINAAISSNASEKIRRFPFIGRFLYSPFSIIAAQTEKDLTRFKYCCPENKKICFGGNLKFDIPIKDDKTAKKNFNREKLGFENKDLIFIAGSTHPKEEVILLETFSLIKKNTHKNIKMIIAPRSPDRAMEIMSLCEKLQFNTVLRTKVNIVSTLDCTASYDLLILDTLGELTSCYALGDFAFVGGSLVPIGGHNLFEPAAYGLPVLFGPYVESCNDMALALTETGGGKEVTDAEHMANIILYFINNPSSMLSAGNAAKEVVKKSRGVTENYLKLVDACLNDA